MSKHTHHQSNEEQRSNKEHGAKTFHYDPYLANEAEKSQENSNKADDEIGVIRLRAYQIHLEKGGSDLDNWLEAERSLMEIKPRYN